MESYRNTTFAAPLKYASNIWRYLDMPLIVNLNQNLNGRSIAFTLSQVLMILMSILIIAFTINDIRYMILITIYQKNKIKNYQNVLAKHLKDQ